MLGKSGDYAKTGKLIVTVAAVAVDPTGLAAAGAGLDAYLHHHDRLAGRTPDLARLSAETGRKLDTALRAKRFDKPDGARTLLPQMLDCALPRGEDFVAHGLDHDAILDALVARLTEPEHTRPEMIAAFRTLYGPLLAEVCNDPRLKQALDPALVRDRVQREKRIERSAEETNAMVREMQAQIATLAEEGKTHPDSALNDLRDIAAELAHDRPHRATWAELVDYVLNKVRQQAEAIARLEARDDLPAADNLRKEIADLFRARRYAEANARADEIIEMEKEAGELHTRLERVAFALEVKAETALQENRVEDAFGFLCRAANSFDSIDKLEPARRRVLRYFGMLHEHGLRFGGRGLSRAADLLRPVLTEDLREADAWLWAAGQNSLGVATQEQGRRTAGPEGAALLADSVAAYRAALRIFTEDAHPVDWATTLQNLGTALQTQGERTAGPAGAALLSEAVAAYRAALRVRTEDAHPVDWAMTMQNLAAALQIQGECTAGPEGAALLNEAVATFRAALRVTTEDAHPVDWAMTMQNLGNALRNQGSRTAGPKGAALLAEAVAAYRAALRVRTESDHPVDWAVTQENMALAEEAIAAHDATDDPRPHLEAALDHVTAALRVYDPEHMSQRHQAATDLHDRIAAKLRDLDD